MRYAKGLAALAVGGALVLGGCGSGGDSTGSTEPAKAKHQDSMQGHDAMKGDGDAMQGHGDAMKGDDHAMKGDDAMKEG